MPRPLKQGIDYFPFDVDFFNDKKIKLIKSEFGIKGEILAIRLLCLIYTDEGYYYQWGEDECLLLTNEVGSDLRPNLVNEIVLGLVRRGFFDKNLFDSFKILTSTGIQKRYVEATKRRVDVPVNQQFWLIEYPQNFKQKMDKKVNDDINEVNVNINSVNANINRINDDKSTQSKVKESKEEKKEKIYKKEKSKISNSPPLFSPPTCEEVQQYAESINFFFNAEEFISYYKAVGWKMGEKLKPMQDWKGAVDYWKQNGVQHGNKNGDGKQIPGNRKHADSLEDIGRMYQKYKQQGSGTDSQSISRSS